MIPYAQNKFPPIPILHIALSAPGESDQSPLAPALIDTGSDFTLVPEKWLRDLDAPRSRPARVDRQIGNFVSEHGLGYIIPAPFEVHLSASSRPVQPDITFIRTERISGHALQIFEGASDLIVEVLSPESIRRDRVIKFTAYEAAGVTEYWIANPNARTVEVYILSHGEYASLGEFKEAETIQSQVLAGIEIVTNSLFT